MANLNSGNPLQMKKFIIVLTNFEILLKIKYQLNVKIADKF